MAYDGWFRFNGVEIVNLSRTAQLAEAIGVGTVWITPSSVEWIEEEMTGYGFGDGPFGEGPLGGFPGSSPSTPYVDPSKSPWYDPEHPASVEFAGVVPLSVSGLDDSSLESSTTEYITDGGNSGRSRNATQPLVFNVALIASTERGTEYGKRWLSRVLRGGASVSNCVGSTLQYFRYDAPDAPVVHRNNVRLTRGISVTRKANSDCASTWLATFTMTANDPFEYGEEMTVLDGLGNPAGPTSAGLISSGQLALTEIGCPVYDYSPIYDPLYPAMVSAPSVPDFYPAGWGIYEGMTFDRFWARIEAAEPSLLNVVPSFLLTTPTDARMVRATIWPGDSSEDDRCDPLFSVVVTYLPAGQDFYIDGELQASYVWDGFSAAVRRTDSLVYSHTAKPVRWTAFNDMSSFLVTLDVFSDSDFPAADVRLAVSLTPKSD